MTSICHVMYETMKCDVAISFRTIIPTIVDYNPFLSNVVAFVIRIDERTNSKNSMVIPLE